MSRLRLQLPRRRTPSGGTGRRARLVDSSARARRRALAAYVLLALGVALIACGVLARQVPAPPVTEVHPAGETAVPSTWFFQDPWVLFADVPDPRRVPSAEELSCSAARGLEVPPQPEDMTRYGSRVVDGRPLAAALLLSRSDPGAAIRCTDAARYGPLYLAPASTAPPFTPTAIIIAGFLALVAAGLTHPATSQLHLGRRDGRSPRARQGDRPGRRPAQRPGQRTGQRP